MSRSVPSRRKNSTGQHTYTVVITPRASGGYLAICPALPAVAAEASTMTRAQQRVTKQIAEHVEHLLNEGQSLPDDAQIASVTIAVKVENPSSAEDLKDARDARRARDEARRKGTIPWEQLKGELGL